MTAALKASLLPGTVPFLLWALLLGVALLFGGPRTSRWARRWLSIVTLAYLLLAMPAIAARLAAGAAHHLPPATLADVSGASAIVVLDGGAAHLDRGELTLWPPARATALRALEAARIYRMLDQSQGPSWVFVTAGNYAAPERVPEGGPLRDALIQLGVPAARVVLDSQSPNTHAHAVSMKAMLSARGVSRFVLVTSATHMPRAVAAFHDVGLQPIAAPAPWHGDSDPSTAASPLLPSADALALSQEAIYEYAGSFYYRIRGWAGRSPNGGPGGE